MSWLAWVFVAGIGAVVAAASIEAYLKRNKPRQLSDMKPDPGDISRLSGITRYGMDPVDLAQAEHDRLQREGWTPDLTKAKEISAAAQTKGKDDDRRKNPD